MLSFSLFSLCSGYPVIQVTQNIIKYKNFSGFKFTEVLDTGSTLHLSTSGDRSLRSAEGNNRLSCSIEVIAWES